MVIYFGPDIKHYKFELRTLALNRGIVNALNYGSNGVGFYSYWNQCIIEFLVIFLSTSLIAISIFISFVSRVEGSPF